MTIEWTVNGATVGMEGWQATQVAPGGFERFSGTALSSKVDADQGAPVVGYRPDGSVLYFGEIVAEPKLIGGKVAIAAAGPKDRLDKTQDRFPYRLRDYSLWASAEAEPYSYGRQADVIRLDTSPGLLKWTMADGVTFAGNEKFRAVLWVPGFPIKRVFFTLTQSFVNNFFSFTVGSAVGPTGAETLRATISLSSLVSQSVDETWTSATHDMVGLTLKRTASGVATIDRSWTATGLGVDVWAVPGAMTAAVVRADLGVRLGLDTSGVQSATGNAMPLDWVGTAMDLFNYLELIDGHRTMIGAKLPTGYELQSGPWTDNRWEVSSERSTNYEGLENEELFNRVVIHYSTTANAPATYTLAASPDPLASTGIINSYLQDLNDPQDSTTLPARVAQTLIAQVSSARVRGSIPVARAWTVNGEVDAYDITAGGIAYLRDYVPALGDQRIAAVTYHPDGVADVAIGREVSVAALLAKAAQRNLRRPVVTDQ